MNSTLAAILLLAAVAVSGCAGRRRASTATQSTATASTKPSAENARAASSAPVNAAVAPATFYVSHGELSARYLNALLNDPGLAKAYNGYYLKQKQPLAKIWSNFKKAADQVLRLASVYPAVAAGAGAYRSVTKAENLVKKEFSNEEKMASEVERDIQSATAQAAQEIGAQVVMDSQSSPLLYLNPSWNLTDRVLEALIQIKKAQLDGTLPPHSKL
ncbi:MAG: hypothetical protein AAB091_06745 [Elusimicrobiota bacterium]